MSAIDRINRKAKIYKAEEESEDKTKLASSERRIKALTDELRTTGKIDYGETIAPVRTTKKKTEDKPWYKTIIKGSETFKGVTSAFDDGYDFGDVSKTFFKGAGATVKTAGATAADVGLNLLEGVVRVGEGVGNLVAGGVAQVADWTGNDDYATMVRNRLAGKEKNAFGTYGGPSSAFLNEQQKKLDKNSVLGESGDEVASLVGYTGGLIVGGQALGAVGGTATVGTSSAGVTANLGNVAINVGKHSLNVPTLAFVGGASSGLTEAYGKENVTDMQAWSKALGSGAIEGVTEGLFGMFGVGGSSVDDLLAKQITDQFKSGVAKTLASTGVKASGEAIEEFLSYAGNQGLDLLIDKASKESSADFYSEWDWEEVGEQMGMAFISAGITQGGGTVVNANTQANIAIKNAEHELGRKLSSKEKNEVRDQVLKSVVEQQLAPTANEINNTTTQEAQTNSLVDLPSNTLNNVKTPITKSVEQLQTELANARTTEERSALAIQIQALENGYQTVEDYTNVLNQERAASLDIPTSENINGTQIVPQTEIQNNSQNNTQVVDNQEVSNNVNLRARNFTYQEAETNSEITTNLYRSASEVMNDTKESHDFVEVVSKIANDTNTQYEFTNNEKLASQGIKLDGKTVNGLVTQDGKVLINIDSNEALNRVVGHETTHLLEGTEEYTALQNAVKDYATSKGEYDLLVAKLHSLYKGTNANIDNEVTSELVGKYLFTDQKFIDNLSAKEPNVFKKVYNYIKHIYNMATAGSKEARQLEKVKYMFDKAYKKASQNKSNTTQENNIKYSIVGINGVKNLEEGKMKSALFNSYEAAQQLFNDNKNKMSAKELQDFIYNQTYWYQDKNGNWKIEIPDKDMKIEFTKEIEVGKEYTLSDIVDHNILYALYPDFKNYKLVIDNYDNNSFISRLFGKNNKNYKSRGSFDSRTKTIFLNKNYVTDSRLQEAVRKTIIHELQHAIQHVEGFETGASSFFGKNYASSYGEAEARVTSERINKNSYERHNILEPFYQEQNKNRNERLNQYLDKKGIIDSLKDNLYNYLRKESSREILKKLGIEIKEENRTQNPQNFLDGERYLNEELDNSSFFNEDNQGRKLTAAQQEYFKDSKVRDENGNLLVMYHGTRSEFNVFDKNRAGKNYEDGWSQNGKGFYFTREYNDAYEYSEASVEGDKRTVKEVYLNVENPFYSYENYSEKLSDLKEKYNLDDYSLKQGHRLVSALNQQGYDSTAVLQELGYDGVIDIFDGKIEDVVAFESNQIKNVDNTNPTKNEDIRYSLSEEGVLVDNKGNEIKLETSDTGTHGTLMAIHNLNESKLKGILELGGFPVPSIAIMNPSKTNLEYGNISVLFNKDTIDPSNKSNEVYGSDVYSPRFPQTVQKINTKELTKLEKYLGKDLYLEDTTLDETVQKNRYTKELINAFAKENNITVEDVYKDSGFNYTFSTDENVRNFIIENDITYDKLLNDQQIRAEFYDLYRQSTPEAVRNFTERKIETFEKIFNEQGNNSNNTAERLNSDFDSIKNGAEKIKDDFATEKALRDKILNEYSEQYTKFLTDKFSPVFEDKYIRNNKELFTPAGNRRSFNQLYNNYTLDNVVKEMKGKVRGEEGVFYGAGNIRSQVTPQFKSIADIKASESKLITNSQMEAVKQDIDSDLNNLSVTAGNFGGYSYDSYENALNEIAQLKKITNKKAREILEEYGFENVPDILVDKSIEFLEKLKNAPTEYFEAKPQRAVGLDEVEAIVIPNNITADLKQELYDKGLYIVEYDPKIEGDKSSKINSFDELKFSLSNQTEETSSYGNYNVRGEDVKLQVEEAVAPLQEEIAELKETIENIAPVREIVDEGRALTEADLPMLEQQTNESLQNITDNDIAPVREEVTPEDDGPTPDVESPMEQRDIDEVGKRSVKAYQYENPDFRPFFQEEAKNMLIDLDNSIKGERMIIGDTSQFGNANDQQYIGIKRQTTDDIAYLLDNYNYSYADIEKGLKAIIEDHGAENIAVAKRIEFLLDERLREGYTDAQGYDIPANQDYINFLREKEYDDYYSSIPQNDIEPNFGEEYTASEENIDVPIKETFTVEDIRNKVKRLQQSSIENATKNHPPLTDKFVEELIETSIEWARGSGKLIESDTVANEVKTEEVLRVSPEMESKPIPKDPTKESSYDNDVPMTRKQIERKLDTVNKKIDKLSELQDKVVPSKADKYHQQLQELTEERNQLEEDITNTPEKKSRKAVQRELVEKTGIVGESLDNANRMSKLMLNNTDPIRIQEMVFGQEIGKKINDEFFQKVKDNTTDKIRWQNSQRDIIKKLGIKSRSKESAAVQKYAEKQVVSDKGNVTPYGDYELALEFPNVATQNKIKRAAQEIRRLYDEYLDTVNPILTELGYDPIPKRKDYVRHFNELSDKFSQWGIPLNLNDLKANDLPTDINGLTADFNPGKNFFASTLQRTGMKTTYDAITGIDGYLEGIGNLIYHTEDVQRLRGLESYIRDTYGEQHGFENIENLPKEQQIARLKAIENKNLSNYASWLHEYTNQLAGKKSMVDRSVEDLFGRKIFSLLDTANKQVGANMIGFNISSAMTNAIAAVQSIAKTNKVAAVKGLYDTVTDIFHRDGFVEKNGFLTSRFGSERLSKTAWQKIQDVGFMFMQGTDYFISNFVVRSKFNELKSQGLSDTEAHKEAGKYASKLMADRSQGAQPTIYNSKTLSLFTKFQYEVNNQLYSMFYDTYHESKAKANGNVAKMTGSMAMTLGQLAVFTHIFGATFEKLAGYNPTFDIISILAKALGLDDDEDDEDTLTENLGQAFKELLSDLPYSNLFLDGGRIPLSEAFTGPSDVLKALTGGQDEFGQDVTWNDAGKSMLETLPYWFLPAGYSQIKKTTGGLGMYDEDLPLPGSYTDSGNLRFTVEDTTENRIQSAIFGKWASPEAREYIDSGFKSINKSRIDELKDLGMKSSEYRKLRAEINAAGKTNKEKVDYITSLNNLNDFQKNILINNILDRDYDVDVSDYDSFSSYEEFDYSYKYPEKYEWLKENNISYKDFIASDESKEMYNYAYNNPEKFEVGKAATNNFSDYYYYKKDINELKADKDSDGKSISGSRKNKVVSYVNSLDLTIPQKAMIIRTEYESFDDYNNQIVEYVSNLDIDYAKKVTILQELDMEVDSEGNVRW